jgi:hypothetical protein
MAVTIVLLGRAFFLGLPARNDDPPNAAHHARWRVAVLLGG